MGNYAPHIELQADVLAGYWGGGRIRDQQEALNAPAMWVTANKNFYLQYAASLGDYAFNSSSHHGTPAQRHRATQIGFDAGYARRYGSLERAYNKRLYDWSRNIAEDIQPLE